MGYFLGQHNPSNYFALTEYQEKMADSYLSVLITNYDLNSICTVN